MEKYSNIKSYNPKDAKLIVGLKSTSYKDYLAARHLTNANFLHQGAILMNTSLEKCLKIYLIVAYNFSIAEIKLVKHDIFKLYNELLIKNNKIASNLNSGFFEAISKVYKSRYYDSISPPYNFVILKNQFLAEFDSSFKYLDSLTRISRNKEMTDAKTNLEIDIENKNPFLTLNNYLINDISKEEFLKQPEIVYEFRVAPNHEIVEALYQIPFTKHPNDFLHEGLKIAHPNDGLILSQG